jgi:hypothetical protein
MILDTCRHLRQGIGRPLIRQPALRATFLLNCCSYLKTKIDVHLFADNQMADLENKANEYESPNEGGGNVGSLDLYKSPSPLQPLCTKRQ